MFNKKLLFIISLTCLIFFDIYASTVKSDKTLADFQPVILFVGSSSIEMWDYSPISLKKSFPNYHIVNKAKGGTDYTFLIREINHILYETVSISQQLPNATVVYSGDNDMIYVANDNRSEIIFNRVKEFHNNLQKELVNIINVKQFKLEQLPPIIYLSIKPSPSRVNVLNYTLETNTKLSNWITSLSETPINKINDKIKASNVYFVDIFKQMIYSQNNTNNNCLTNAQKEKIDLNKIIICENYFLSDKLHMNEHGYKIWVNQLSPLLNKLLNTNK